MDDLSLPAGEQRACERLPLSRRVSITATAGVVAGRLVNVSLGGVLVNVGADIVHFVHGDHVQLAMSAGATEDDYPCTVVRVTDDGLLGLAMDREAAPRFALAITRGMFERTKRAAVPPVPKAKV